MARQAAARPINSMVIPPPTTVRHLSTDTLREHLGLAIEMTARSIAYLAAVWVELERRGEDLSDLRISLAPYLREVASGRLAPEAVLAFAGQRMVLRWVAKQPLDEQLALAGGKPVTVIEPDGSRRSLPAAALSAFDLRQIMSPAPTAEAPRPRRGRRPTATEPSRTVAVTLRASEYQVIVDAARDAGMSLSDAVRTRLSLPAIGGGPR